MTLDEIRKQFPQWAKLTDEDLLKKVHEEFYSDWTLDKFLKEVGWEKPQPSKPKKKPPVINIKMPKQEPIKPMLQEVMNPIQDILKKTGRDQTNAYLRAMDSLSQKKEDKDIKVFVNVPKIDVPASNVTVEKQSITKWEFTIIKRDENGFIRKFKAEAKE